MIRSRQLIPPYLSEHRPFRNGRVLSSRACSRVACLLLFLSLLLWDGVSFSAFAAETDSSASRTASPSSKALEEHISRLSKLPARVEKPGTLTGTWTPPLPKEQEGSRDDERLYRHFLINYVVDVAEIDTAFMDNAARIRDLRRFLRRMRDDGRYMIDSVKFTGTASPDGYIEYNRWLSENRLDHFKDLISEEIELPDSIIFLNDSYITWQNFREGVEQSDIPRRNQVLEVIDMPADTVRWYRGMHTDARLLKLRSMDKGRVWETLKPILYYLRFADAEFVLKRRPFPEIVPPLPTIDVTPLPLVITGQPRELWIRRLYIKTNFVKWSLLLSNLSVEVDLIRHWTLGLTMFYSKWDYFIPEIRFRMAGFMTELRYWFNPEENDGWFIGAHYGYSYYNLGFNGAHRYQDLYGQTPTRGGGLAFGWRKQFGHNNRWRFELSAGAGIYPLHYSVFQNTHDYRNGRWLEARRQTFYGLDEFSVSVGYAIDMFKKSVPKKQWWQ